MRGCYKMFVLDTTLTIVDIDTTIKHAKRKMIAHYCMQATFRFTLVLAASTENSVFSFLEKLPYHQKTLLLTEHENCMQNSNFGSLTFLIQFLPMFVSCKTIIIVINICSDI